jgi:hypothetical protein
MVPTIAGVISYEGGKFYTFGGNKTFYKTSIGQASPWATCMIGSATEALAQIFSYLFEVVCKRSMRNDERRKRLGDGMLDGFSKILAEEGISGLYRGFWVRFVKGAPSAALGFIFLGAFTKGQI